MWNGCTAQGAPAPPSGWRIASGNESSPPSHAHDEHIPRLEKSECGQMEPEVFELVAEPVLADPGCPVPARCCSALVPHFESGRRQLFRSHPCLTLTLTTLHGSISINYCLHCLVHDHLLPTSRKSLEENKSLTRFCKPLVAAPEWTSLSLLRRATRLFLAGLPPCHKDRRSKTLLLLLLQVFDLLHCTACHVEQCQSRVALLHIPPPSGPSSASWRKGTVHKMSHLLISLFLTSRPCPSPLLHNAQARPSPSGDHAHDSADHCPLSSSCPGAVFAVPLILCE